MKCLSRNIREATTTRRGELGGKKKKRKEAGELKSC